MATNLSESQTESPGLDGSVALESTKTTGVPVTQLSTKVVVEEPPKQSPKGAFLQTMKSFGWPAYLLVAVIVALYFPILRHLVWQWWNDADYSHGFLVPVLSAFLMWQRREKLASIVRKPANSGLFILFGSLGVLFLGSLGAELFLSRISLLGVICGLIVYFTGWAMLRALAFPLAFLLFCIPLPTIVYNEIVFPLQFVASKFATSVLETLNLFPVMREGNVLVMPEMRLEVVEACSGIRSLMSLLALAAGYGYLAERSVTVRWLLFFSMIPLAIVSNGTRVVITALMTHYIGPQAAEGFMHEFSGWVIFVVATVLFLALHSLTVLVRRKMGWMPAESTAKEVGA